MIEGADEISVKLNDNREFKGRVIGTDPSTDLALVKIEGDDFPTIPVGDSEALKVGEWVLAVGNPFNLNSTVTAGIVSAKARSLGVYNNGIESFIQTDAAINQGNSGGALVDLTDYSMKLLEKKFDIDGHKEFYLSTVVFQYTTAEPEKKKLQAIQDAAVQAVQENYQDEPHVEAQVAMLIANQAADNDNKVTVEQVRQQLAEEYPLAAVPFDDYVEKSDILEPAQAQQPVTVSPSRIRRMESRSIHTASGIEVKIPTEILSEDSAVEFLHAEDGSVSLLIKNVIL